MPGVNYVSGSSQLRWRVGAPTPRHGSGGGLRRVWSWLAAN